MLNYTETLKIHFRKHRKNAQRKTDKKVKRTIRWCKNCEDIYQSGALLDGRREDNLL